MPIQARWAARPTRCSSHDVRRQRGAQQRRPGGALRVLGALAAALHAGRRRAEPGGRLRAGPAEPRGQPRGVVPAAAAALRRGLGPAQPAAQPARAVRRARGRRAVQRRVPGRAHPELDAGPDRGQRRLPGARPAPPRAPAPRWSRGLQSQHVFVHRSWARSVLWYGVLTHTCSAASRLLCLLSARRTRSQPQLARTHHGPRACSGAILWSKDTRHGAQGVLAGLAQASGTWEQCLQGYGVLTKDKTVCGNT